MDVSVDYANDPKWRSLQRHAPDHLGTAFIAYSATMCASWRAGRRVTVTNAWPPYLAFDDAAVEALKQVRLLDRTGLIALKTWRDWFETAYKRRESARERWRRHNENRNPRTDGDADTAGLPRGTNAVTASSVPPVRPSVPPDTEQGVTPLDGGPPRLGLVKSLEEAG
jgi:hypothetical protein